MRQVLALAVATLVLGTSASASASRPTISPCTASDCTLETEGFPAVSADGRRIAIALGEDDGGRGNPNLTIVFVDAVTGRETSRTTVLTPDEYERLAGSLDPVRDTVAFWNEAVRPIRYPFRYWQLAPRHL